MKISKEKPEIYEKLHERFGVDWEKGIIITYGDTVHCKFPLSDDLLVHEQTHIDQQAKIGKEVFFEKYMSDSVFRLIQEVEAYQNQWKYIKSHYNHQYRRFLKKKLSTDMANLYGNMCTKQEAETFFT